MSDLPHSWPGYIQVQETQVKAGVTEAVMQKFGQAINYLKDASSSIVSSTFHTQLFTSSGTFNVPSTTSFVILYGAGGGGQGGWGSDTGPYGGAGGCGAMPQMVLVPVTPSAAITVTIGIGGTGSISPNDGTTGSPTTFGSIYTFGGGAGGTRGNAGSLAPVTTVINNTMIVPGGAGENPATNGPLAGTNWGIYTGGAIGGGVVGRGGGGGASFGDGGAGGATGAPGTNAAANSAAGGGGGGNTGGSGHGGNGGSGRLYVIYWS